MLKKIWLYRQFIYSSVKREFLSKYKGSLLGSIWSVLQPLSMIFVYTVIFSEVMRAKLTGMGDDRMAYSIYLCAGVLTWGFFSELIGASINVFLANGNLLKKLSFPRICLPVITISSSFINFMIGWVLFFVALIIMGRFPFENILWCIPLLILQTILAAGLGIGLGVINVFFRDVGQLFGVILQFWFWFTPIVYPAAIIPEKLLWLEMFNPMYPIITGYQNIFVYGKMPEFSGLLEVFILSIVIGVWALHMYRKHVGEMVDEL